MLQEESLTELTELQEQLQEQSWFNALSYVESEILGHIKFPEKCKQILFSSINYCYLVDRIERLLQKDEYKILKPKNNNNTNDKELYPCELEVTVNHVNIHIPFKENILTIYYHETNTIHIFNKNTSEKRTGNKIDELILKTIHDCNINTCEYIFTRGNQKGKKCETKALNDGTPGSDIYCRQCIKKTGAKAMIEKYRRGEDYYFKNIDYTNY